MKTKHAGIIKITRPRLQKIVRRTRLFRILDGNNEPVTWISGPAGSGKTTIIASWLDAKKRPSLWYHLDPADSDIATFYYFMGLAAAKAAPGVRRRLPLFTPEYRGGIQAFSRRYFKDLYARMQPRTVIVLDNYHHLAAGSPLHDVIREAFTVVPPGLSVIVSSRSEVPPSLALFRAYGNMGLIGWEDLKFDRNETAVLLKAGRKAKPAEELLARAQTLTMGWAAGLVLLTERLRIGHGLAPVDQLDLRELFDYFATELFEKTDRDDQLFLLKTAHLPSMSPHSTAELTGHAHAASLLANLSRNHFFTEQRSITEPVYQYHPLFREFLLARAAETFSKRDLGELRRKAGVLLESAGQDDDAAECYRAAEAWDRLANLIVATAASLAAQGRYRSLEERLSSLPPAVLEDDPWLLYWMGVSRMPLSLPEGHRYFDRALALFRRKKDAEGVFRAWSGAIESLVQEMGDIRRLDQWVALVFELMKEYDFPSREIEDEVTARLFAAMPWDPSDPVFVEWRKRAMLLIEHDADPDLRLMTAFYILAHHIWIGDYATGKLALDIIRRIVKAPKNVSPLACSMGKICESWSVWLTGDHQQSYSIMQDALAKANESGVHIWDRNMLEISAAACLCKGDLAEADRLLEQMAIGLEAGRLFDKFYYRLNSAWLSLLKSDLPSAVAHQERALELAERSGFPISVSEALFGSAVLANALGDRTEARRCVSELHAVGRRMGSSLVEYMGSIASAIIALAEDDAEDCVHALRNALRLSRERGMVYFKFWIPSLMTELCMKALEAGAEIGQAKHLISTCGLAPAEPPMHLESWPWPVRVYTLGAFRLVVKDRSVHFSGKVQKKPLDMLKALIALGGTGLRKEQLHDALWPDAEGDAAGASFRTTLHRLRQLIGSDNAVIVQEGRVSLDRRFCWVDAWAFERVLGDAKGTSGKTAADRMEQALALYRGHFLQADDDKTWTASMREKLRSKFLRAIRTRGDDWRRQADASRTPDVRKDALKMAVASYERGIEVDDVAEEFYQDLMLCHQQLGAKAEAIKVYKRCKAALSAAFGIVPSEETESIYRDTIGGLS